jgi:hypothetical protein
MMRDDKLVSAAIKSKQSVERVVWVWGAILESATEIDKGGKYELDIAEVAYFLRSDEGDISSIITALSELGRVRNRTVVKWGDRQFQSDKSKTRVAAFRKRRQTKVVHADNGNALENINLDTVTVTLPKRYGNAPETETETYNTLSKDSGENANSDKEFWASAKSYLGGKNPGALIGKWCRDYPKKEVAKAIGAAQVERAVDPVPYVERVLRGAKNEGWDMPLC